MLRCVCRPAVIDHGQDGGCITSSWALEGASLPPLKTAPANVEASDECVPAAWPCRSCRMVPSVLPSCSSSSSSRSNVEDITSSTEMTERGSSSNFCCEHRGSASCGSSPAQNGPVPWMALASGGSPSLLSTKNSNTVMPLSPELLLQVSTLHGASPAGSTQFQSSQVTSTSATAAKPTGVSAAAPRSRLRRSWSWPWAFSGCTSATAGEGQGRQEQQQLSSTKESKLLAMEPCTAIMTAGCRRLHSEGALAAAVALSSLHPAVQAHLAGYLGIAFSGGGFRHAPAKAECWAGYR